jgi:hypothetical protein
MMTTAVAPKPMTTSRAEFVAYLRKLAKELMRLGFIEEADRAREIANEVCALRDLAAIVASLSPCTLPPRGAPRGTPRSTRNSA